MSEGTNKQIEFLRGQLKANIDGFRIRRLTSKKKAFRLRMAVVILGAVTTLLLGIKNTPLLSSQGADWVSAAALAFSAAVPIFSAWDAFFDHRWLWTRYTTAQTSLYAILDDLEFAIAGNEITNEKIDELYAQFRAVLQETNSAWADKRTKLAADDNAANEGRR
ncbi:DUF4231 domain-containing protein [Xanthobacter versatilis]|uniref:DUF4231 domain-containing protein n=1 Tax=Xanthobacter autotrophicus (strain ATCC BAA-1158 / Py2) TaxID=78245 RepID=UPI00372C295E